MSLILKGIDIPNSGQIEIIIRPHGKVFSKTRGISAEAIQIPKDHGRLIDAGLLKDTIRDSVPAYTIGVKIPTFGDTQIMSAIDVMPTILAEE